MTTPSQQLIRRLASLAAGRNIVWTDQTAIDASDLVIGTEYIDEITGNGIPASDEGVSLDPGDGSTPLRFFWRVKPRQGVLSSGVYEPWFTCNISVASVINSNDYHVSINDGGGAHTSTYTSDADATEAEILAGLKTELETTIAAQSWGLKVTNETTYLHLYSDSSVANWSHQNFSVSQDQASGYTGLTIVTDASTCTFEVWYRLSGLATANAQFDRYQFPDGNYTLTVTHNASGVVDIPGADHAKIVLTAGDGLIQPSIGVCKIET
jgi:hypothetical protein